MINADLVIELARTQLVQLTAAIALAAAITFIAPRRAHLAYAVWLVVIVKALTPPVWSSPLGVFSWLDASSRTQPASTWVEPRSHPDVTDAPIVAAVVQESPRRMIDAAPSSTLQPVDRRSQRARESPPVVSGIDLKHALVALWAGGSLIALAVPLVGLVRLQRRVRQRSIPISDALAAQIDRVRAAVGLSRRVRLVVCDGAIGPAVVGVIRPTVVLPQSLVEGDEALLNGALAHEFVHVRRRDSLVVLLQWAATALWWFFPPVWWMNGKLNAARELSCDEEAIAALRCPPAAYAQMLLDTLRQRRAAVADRFTLGVNPLQVNTKRLEHIMEPSAQFQRRNPIVARVLAVALALLLLPGARLVLHAADAVPQPPTQPATQPTGPLETLHFGGTIVDADTQQPIGGATVVVHRSIYDLDDSNSRLADDTTLATDAAGKFAFDVPPDQQAPEKRLYLALDVRHPKYASQVGAGYGLSLIKHDMQLGNKPWFDKIALRPGEEVTGVLLDPAGKPVAGVPIDFCSVNGPYDRRFLAEGEDRVDDTTVTDTSGRFGFVAIKGSALNYFWAKPKDAAILFHSVRDERGDLGTFRLENGVSIPGVVLTFDGKPVPNVGVSLESVQKNDVQNEITVRHAHTDEQGKFAFAPVEPGAYELGVTNMIFDDDATHTRQSVPVPGAFVKQQVVADYKDYNQFPPVEVRALEHATVELRYIDSSGKPRKGHSVDLFGKRGGESFILDGKPDANGVVRMFVPKGVTDARIHLTTDNYSSLRWRRGADGPLQSATKNEINPEIPLGTIADDIKDLFVVRYEAPVLVIRGVDADGKPVDAFRPAVRYPGDEPTTRSFTWIDGIQGDVSFDRQDDRSWRTSQLLPDVELRVSGSAEGYTATQQVMTMKEKETRGIAIQLRKR